MFHENLVKTQMDENTDFFFSEFISTQCEVYSWSKLFTSPTFHYLNQQSLRLGPDVSYHFSAEYYGKYKQRKVKYEFINVVHQFSSF